MEFSKAISKSTGVGINRNSRHYEFIVFVLSPDLFCVHNFEYLGMHLAKHWFCLLLWPL